MKKSLCFVLILTLLLSLAACGGRPEPTAEPTFAPAEEAASPTPGAEPSPEPTPAPTAETAETARAERAAEYLRSRDYDYVVNNLGVYVEYYRLTHPGAEVYVAAYSAMYPHIRVDLAGADAKAFWDSGLLPSLVDLGIIVEAREYPEGSSLIQAGFPEAELLLTGLPENVESASVGRVTWPALSCSWKLREVRSVTDDTLVSLLLGEAAEYDPEAAVYRAGDLTLDLKEGARLTGDTPFARALALTLPLRDPETLDPREVPAPEEAGWVKQRDPGDAVQEIPFLSLYASREEELTLPVGEEQGNYTLVTGGVYETYLPDGETLNARLEAVLEEKRAELGEEGFRAEYGDLADLSFAPEDLQDLFLIRVPVRADLGGFALDYVTPWGELEAAAAWCLYSRSRGLLALSAPLIGYDMEPWGQTETDTPWYETGSPWRRNGSGDEESYRFYPVPEEGLRFTGLRYVLTGGNNTFRSLRAIAEDFALSPWWLLEVETASGEVRDCVVSAKIPYGYAFQERCYLTLLSRRTPKIFAAYREQHPDADVWVSSWGLSRDGEGKEYIEATCYGVDIPALEASGFLPRGFILDYSESPFNQKEAHPCPREPEWEKKYWSQEREDAVTLTMARAVYPLYPEYVEVTVRCKKTFHRDWYGLRKYVDGEWKDVFRVLTGTQQFLYVEAGETTLQIPTLSKLGPGLYRVYLNQEYWVEFAVSEDPAVSGEGTDGWSFDRSSVSQADTEELVRRCTHIVKAEYAGTESWDRGEMLAFIPLEIWKGEIRDERIYLQAEDPVLLGRQGFRTGDTVILLLNRHISVYYPHDIYTAAGGYALGALEKERVDSLLADAPPLEKDHYGVEYTLSGDLKEILEATECIFTVEPVSVSVPGGKEAITWLCRVRAALRGEPVYREIHIVFFPEDVEEGKEYLVLLNNVDGGTLYTLSSRNSVYPLEEAGEIPELRTLLENAVAVDVPEEPTEEEILAAERQAAGMS